MRCHNCGTENNDSSKFCLACGSGLTQPIAPMPVANDVPSATLCPAWPEWEIGQELGRGSYGTVYQAVRNDNNVESRSAIKIISIPSDPSEVESLRAEGMDIDSTRSFFKGVLDDFIGEISVMQSLKGTQNIVSVEDYKVIPKTDSIGWDIYIRMELLTPFNTHICGKALTEEEIIKLGTDICSALEICNQRNIIHRDIKPENIFVNDFGYYKLGDFGIAKKLENVSGSMSQKGTFNYMAPEVAAGTNYDSRVDTYSLGIVLYRLLNGNRLPFISSEQQAINHLERKAAADRRLNGEPLPAPSDASPEMADVVLRACAFDPKDRFASASEMKAALVSISEGTYVPVVAANAEADISNTDGEIDYDATVSVRRAKASLNDTAIQQEQSSSATTSAKITEAAPKTRSKKKKKKGKVIAIAILVAILLLAITLAVLFFTGAPYSVYKSMQDCKHSEALSEYRSDVSGSSLNEMLHELLLGGDVSRAAENYESGTWDYNETYEHLHTLDYMGIDGAAEKLDEITEKHASSIVEKYRSSAIDAKTAKEEINKLADKGYKNGNEKITLINEAEANAIAVKYMAGDIGFNEAKHELTVLINEDCEKASEKLIEIEDIAADAIVAEYKADMITYYQAKQKLENLGNDAYTRNIHKLDAEQIENILAQAKAAADKENYQSALNIVNSGLSSYPNSEKLLQKAEEYRKLLHEQVKASTLAEAASLAEAGNYKDAMILIENAINRYGSDDEYAEAYITYKNEYTKVVKEAAISDAAALATQKDYWGAYKKIADAIAEVGEDEELKAKAKEYEDAYISSVLPQIDARLKDNKVNEAKEMIRDATAKFPDNEELKKRAETLDMYKTVLLNSLKPTNGGFGWNDGVPGDPFGNSYSTTQNYVVFHGAYDNWYGQCSKENTHSAEYQVNKKYDILSFNLVPYSDFGESGWSYLRIYADGALRYTSDKITQKTQPKNISVDISNAEYIKIIVYTSGHGCTMMSDVLLSTSPNYVSSRSNKYTSLSVVSTFNGYLPWEQEFPCDRLGSSYNDVTNYTVLHAAYNNWYGTCRDEKSYSAEYYVNKQYSSFSFDIAPSSDFGSSGSVSIYVYVNDVLAYTAPAITQKTARFNSGNINISNANYIKIVVKVEGYGCVILSDVMLKNK